MTEAKIEFDLNSYYMFGDNHSNPGAEPDELYVEKPTSIRDDEILFHFMRGLVGEAEYVKKVDIVAVLDSENYDFEVLDRRGRYRILNEEVFEKYFASGLLKLKIPEEHERRFLIDLEKVPGNLKDYPLTRILQGYPGDPGGYRIRESRIGHDLFYTKTIKTGSGVSRPEFERKITKEKFDQLWKQTKYFLSKDRYHILWEGIESELNIYCERLDGYKQIEVEFDSNEAAIAFVPPTWFGEEVTDDPRHSNFALAKNGLPN